MRTVASAMSGAGLLHLELERDALLRLDADHQPVGRELV